MPMSPLRAVDDLHRPPACCSSLLWEGQPTAAASPPLPMSHSFRKMRKPSPSRPTKQPPARKKKALCSFCQCPGECEHKHFEILEKKTKRSTTGDTTTITTFAVNLYTARRCSVVLMSCFLLLSLGSCSLLEDESQTQPQPNSREKKAALHSVQCREYLFSEVSSGKLSSPEYSGIKNVFDM